MDSLFIIVFLSFMIGALIMGLFWFFKTKLIRDQHHIQVQLLHNAPLGLCYEKNGQVNLNKHLCLMWNIRKKPHTLNQFLNLIPENEKERFLTYYNGLCQKKMPFDALLKKDKQLFYVRGRLFEEDTRLLWIYDISIQQNQLDQANEQNLFTQNQRDLLQNAWESLPLPVFIHHSNEEIVFANQAANKTDRDLSQLHWVSSSFQVQNEPYTLTYGQETRTEEEVQSMFREVAVAHQRLCQELPCAVCLFNAKGQLVACSKSFAHLWQLDEKWLKAPQDYENFWDTLQEKGLLSRVVDFAQYKKTQREHFSKLSQTEEVFLYLPGGRIIRRLMIPFAQGGVILLDEDKTG